MDDCIFCKIVKGELPSHKIWEDDNTFALLDIHPINPGHILVISKQHIPDFYNLEDEHYSALMFVVKRLATIINKKLQPEKVGLIVAGWDVPHTHVHVIPMHDYHDISKFILWNGPLGEYERGFRDGTINLAKAIAESPAQSVVGGGDTFAVISKLHLEEEFSFVSTAGGALLEFIYSGTLVGIEALKSSN